MDVRPDSVSAMLVFVADILDSTDLAFEALETLTGRSAPASGGTQVQEDLRVLAETLADNPVFDAELFAKAFPEEEVVASNRDVIAAHGAQRESALEMSTAEEDANFLADLDKNFQETGDYFHNPTI